MFKGKLVVLSLIIAALLCWQIAPVDNANSGIVDPILSICCVEIAAWWLVCPQGDGDELIVIGATISITIISSTGSPIEGIPATDFWIIGITGTVVLCGGSGSSDAEDPTDAAGQTTMEGECAAGGSDVGVYVVCQGIIITSSPLSITVVSPDINGDGIVQLIDLSLFAASYQSPPKPYDYTKDYDGSGTINLIDFSIFAQHYLHSC